MSGFDFSTIPEIKVALLDIEERDRLQAQLEKIDRFMKVFLGSTIVSVGIIFMLMKRSNELLLGLPIWIFIVIVIMVTQIPVGLFIKNLLSRPIEEDLLKGEKVEITTKIKKIIQNNKGTFLEVSRDEVSEYMASLVSLKDYSTGEDVTLGIAPKTKKILSIKKIF